MKQGPNIELVKKIFYNHYLKPHDDIRIIKIHGGKYQEAGLPDLMILVKKGSNHYNFWFEIKRNWKDEPSALQKWNIDILFHFGFITGFIVGNEYKADWDAESILLEELLEPYK